MIWYFWSQNENENGIFDGTFEHKTIEWIEFLLRIIWIFVCVLIESWKYFHHPMKSEWKTIIVKWFNGLTETFRDDDAMHRHRTLTQPAMEKIITISANICETKKVMIWLLTKWSFISAHSRMGFDLKHLLMAFCDR